MTEPAIRTGGLTKDYGQGHGIFDLDVTIEAAAAAIIGQRRSALV